MMSEALEYVLVTPARNEETFIDGTIRSIVAQTVRPKRWVIVSDGSTDGTDAIVQHYASQHPWLELLRLSEHRDRQFAAKAHAFNAGYEKLRWLDFDIVGNLDADITLGPDCYQFLLTKFAESPGLGVAGTPFIEDFSRPNSHSYAHRAADLNHVSGGCQMFRRACFEQIGGYTPIRGGGVDWLAVTTARMKGWQTRTFLERVCFHHRKMGTADRGVLRARFRHGQEDYAVGGHFLWQLLRSGYQMLEQPYLLGGISLFLGYCYAWSSRKNNLIPEKVRAFHRREQMLRLRNICRCSFSRGASGGPGSSH